MEPVRVAIVGCGYWGPNLVRNFTRSDGSKVRWICDRDAGRLQDVARDLPLVCASTQRYADLLEDPKTDAVVVATPVSTHFALAAEALRAGKHVLVEKPLTRTRAEAEELVDLADRKGLVLMVDHTFQYSEPVNRLKGMMDDGTFGRLLYVNSVRVNLGLFQEDINVLWDLASHDVSILDYLLDEPPVEVSAHGTAHIDPRFADVAFVTLYYPGNVMAHLHVSWLDPCKIRRMTLVGDQRMGVYDDMDPNEPIRIYDKGVGRLPYYTDFGEFKLHYRLGDIHSPRVEIVEPLKRVCRHFVECVRGREVPRTDGRCGLRVVSVLESAEASLQRRGERVAHP